MTCIVGLVDKDGTVWMGGDRAISCGDGQLVISRHPKVKDVGGALIGIAGTMALVGLLHRSDWPKYDAISHYGGLIVWIQDTLRIWVWERAKELGTFTTKDGQQILDGCLLIGVEGRLFEIANYGSVLEPHLPFFGIGNPKEAIGVLWAMREWASGPSSAKVALTTALEASAYLTDGVRGPFDILSLPLVSLEPTLT